MSLPGPIPNYRGTLEFVAGAGHWLRIERPRRIDARIVARLHDGGRRVAAPAAC